MTDRRCGFLLLAIAIYAIAPACDEPAGPIPGGSTRVAVGPIVNAEFGADSVRRFTFLAAADRYAVFVASQRPVELLTFRADLTDTNLRVRSVWRRERIVWWDNIRTVKYSPWGRWFILVLQDGTKVRISEYVRGIGDLADALRRHVHEDALAEAASWFAALD